MARKTAPRGPSSLGDSYKSPGYAGKYLDLPHQCDSHTVDAVRHIRLAMNNNPLHTPASSGNLGPVFHGLDWALFSLSTIIVVLRLYTRLWITRNFGLDDATIALTQVRYLSPTNLAFTDCWNVDDNSSGQRVCGHRSQLWPRTTPRRPLSRTVPELPQILLPRHGSILHRARDM